MTHGRLVAWRQSRWVRQWSLMSWTCWRDSSEGGCWGQEPRQGQGMTWWSRLSIKLKNPYQWLYFPPLPDGEGEALVSSTLALARWPVILWKKEWNPIVHPGRNLALQNAVNIKEQCLITLIENLLLICHFFLVFRVTFSCHSVQKFGLALQILGRWQAASPIPNTWQIFRNSSRNW